MEERILSILALLIISFFLVESIKGELKEMSSMMLYNQNIFYIFTFLNAIWKSNNNLCYFLRHYDHIKNVLFRISFHWRPSQVRASEIRWLVRTSSDVDVN